MQNKQHFSNLIYEYFFLRIRFQYYECGDTLPSIDTLCDEFSVSSQTVKSALRRLRSEGYISMHNGRPTTDFTPDRRRSFRLYYGLLFKTV